MFTKPFSTDYAISSFQPPSGIAVQMLLFALMADMIKSHRKLTEENMYLSKKVLYKEK